MKFSVKHDEIIQFLLVVLLWVLVSSGKKKTHWPTISRVKDSFEISKLLGNRNKYSNISRKAAGSMIAASKVTKFLTIVQMP